MTMMRTELALTATRTWIGFGLMCLGMFMAILDIQVVATSLPTIQNALAISPEAMSWIQTSYLIAEIIAIPLTGWLTRILSMRWLFTAAIAFFTLASIGCAASDSFAMLVSFRVVQGFAGGTLIPTVFAAVFILFRPRTQGIATTIAGIMAVLAPTVGPVVGGWITQMYSWHWLFLINVIPGLITCAVTPYLLPRKNTNFEGAKLDGLSLFLMAAALACLEIGLKQSPQDGWFSVACICLFSLSALTGGFFVWRTLRAAHPIVQLSTFGDRSFAIGCVLSFCLGVGLFGSVYLMPVFLAFVRGHDALEIGSTMLVTGVAQLAIAPIAVALERRVDARLLTGVGFTLFAFGLGLSAFETRDTDFSGMFWPQVIRGVAIMFCLLPPTRLALGALSETQVPDASGLFNLMRNLGGAIGIALTDTVLYGRTSIHADALRNRLLAGDMTAATAIGLDPGLFVSGLSGSLTPNAEAYVRPMIEKAAFVWSVNDAWAMLAGFALLGVLIVPFAWKTAKARRLGPADRENLRDQWTPAIHLYKEPAIAVHQPDAAARLRSAMTWRLSERSSEVVSVLGTTAAKGAFALSSMRRAAIEKSKLSSCVMPLSAEADEFLEAAFAALPRITEIIFTFPAEHRAGALEVAECRYRQAARDFGCAEADSEYLVAAVMRKLRTLMEQGDRARETSANSENSTTKRNATSSVKNAS
jgi:MFS transporter, DHA2 family, multidrug resistance protein